ncbi:DsbA family protein [Kocuria sp.]|uniref:DsbA family protein n=1 Tax=Kocuria sp. TaxID=1871328 RepID=UPI0026DEFD0A|nr:thioredoxin domain-containing protein [Kocuria sp.]MDO5617980.1 thioredoxin domain-containing protein [Kocuria sp.]
MKRALQATVIALGIAAVVVMGVIGFGLITGGSSTPQASTSHNAQLVREDSRTLSDGDQAEFVEVLDFECPACADLYPYMEQLREEYGDRVTFVVRYLPMHGNSLGAAQAAEAAAEQGEFLPMYQTLFENFDEWSNSQSSQRDTFFDYARELGLDMDQFSADYQDPATVERIAQNQLDAEALGVTSTPTFFLDGERIQPETMEDMRGLIEMAVAP